MEKMFLFYCIVKCLSLSVQIQPVKQGLTGTVYLKVGNSMPAPGMQRGKGTPVSRTVWVYELTQRTNNEGNFFTNLKTKVIAKTQSAADGTYTITLPTGKFSVFVEEGNKLYANNFDDKGNISPVEIKKDSLSKMDIVVSNRASF